MGQIILIHTVRFYVLKIRTFSITPHSNLGLSTSLFPSAPRIKYIYPFLIYRMHASRLTHLLLLVSITLLILGKSKLRSSSMCNFLNFHVTASLAIRTRHFPKLLLTNTSAVGTYIVISCKIEDSFFDSRQEHKFCSSQNRGVRLTTHFHLVSNIRTG